MERVREGTEARNAKTAGWMWVGHPAGPVFEWKTPGGSIAGASLGSGKRRAFISESVRFPPAEPIADGGHRDQKGGGSARGEQFLIDPHYTPAQWLLFLPAEDAETPMIPVSLLHSMQISKPWRRWLTRGLVGAILTTAVLAVPVPIAGNGPVAVDRLRVNNPAVLPMTGAWKFQITYGEQLGDTFTPFF